VGDLVIVLDNPDDGWCEVVTAFGERGLVPFIYLTQPPRKTEIRSPFKLKEVWAERDFQPAGDFQIPLERGEAVTLLEDPGDGWCTVVTEKGTKGLVPANCLSTQVVSVQRVAGKRAPKQQGSRSRSPSNASSERPKSGNDEDNWDLLTLHILGVGAREAVCVDAAIKIQTAVRVSLAKSVILAKKAEMERGQLLSFLVGVSHNTEENRSLAKLLKSGHPKNDAAIAEGGIYDGYEEDEEGLVVRFFCCTEPHRL
jgi:hypothetical protein